MTADALSELWTTARALPGESLASLPALPVWEDVPPRPATEVGLRRLQMSAWLRDVAACVDGRLASALSASWDQMREVPLLEDEHRARAAELRRAWQGIGRHNRDPGVRAAALEALLALDAVVGIVELLEARLTMLAGLRRESADPRMVVDGRPFLDVAAAVKAAARAWS